MSADAVTTADRPITLPNGMVISGSNSVVIVGPNGAGKTRLSRRITVQSGRREYVNALRNTRISAQLPVMSKLQALQNHQGQRGQAESTPWEIVTDFDFVLAQLLTEDADAARTFRAKVKAGSPYALEDMTALESVEQLWANVFEGRSLRWNDWEPLVINEIADVPQYGANAMSDGERAALYLATKVMLASPDTVLFIDEPETHFHPLLAIKLWDDLETRRPDIRFVYITHDLTFAMSRPGATLLVAQPPSELRVVEFGESLPNDVRIDILGAASFSYYARRTVFCEGDDQSYDARFFNAWFSGRETAVFAVGSCEKVRQCVEVLAKGEFISNLEAVGVIDRDFRPDSFFASLESNVFTLPLHEIEGMVCVPAIFEVLRQHLARDGVDVTAILRAATRDDVVIKTAHERWKLHVRNQVEDVVNSKPQTLDQVAVATHIDRVASIEVPSIDMRALFSDEVARMRQIAESGTALDILRVFPSKSIAGNLASTLQQTVNGLFALIISGLRARDEKDPLWALRGRLEEALSEMGLPPRFAIG